MNMELVLFVPVVILAALVLLLAGGGIFMILCACIDSA